MTPQQRADIEAIINAIGEISKTEALNAIDKIIETDGNQAGTQRSEPLSPSASEAPK